MRAGTIGAIGVGVCVFLIGGGSVARADSGCKTVRGKILEVQIPAPNDPFGRVVGTVTGAINGSASAILTSLVPGAEPGTLEATTQDIFVTKKGDMLVTTGNATFTFVDANTVSDVLTLEVDGAASTGRFAGATGTIVATGFGFNLGAGPGQTYFQLEYKGEVCRP
ncbi:MAG TPA: hypothetical protein VK886_05755 [Vicinamibacterales bacterium]|nr:hypothetical protein [Vicinamibacterales bacterium]